MECSEEFGMECSLFSALEGLESGLGKAGVGGMKLEKARAERNERGSFAVRSQKALFRNR